MDTHNVVSPHNEILLSPEKEKSFDMCYMWVNLEHIKLKEARHKITGGSIYVRCPEQAHPQTWEVGLWLSEAGEGDEE